MPLTMLPAPPVPIKLFALTGEIDPVPDRAMSLCVRRDLDSVLGDDRIVERIESAGR